MAGNPDDWTLMEGGSPAQREVSAQLDRHLNAIKGAWNEVRGDPAAIETAITTASSTALGLRTEAEKLGPIVELRLNDSHWFGGTAAASRQELTNVELGLVELADVLDAAPTSLVGRLNLVEPQVRQPPLEVERIAKGFVADANDLIVQAVSVEFLRQIQAEFNGIVARWNARTVVERQDQALGAVVTGFRRVPRPPPLVLEPYDSGGGVRGRSDLTTPANDLRALAETLTGIGDRYLAASELRPFTFGMTHSGRQIERLYDDFRRDVVDRIRRFAERITTQATVVRNLRAGLENVDTDTAAAFKPPPTLGA